MYPGAGIRAAAAPKTSSPATNSRRTIRRSGLKVEVIDPQIIEGGSRRNACGGIKPGQRRRQSGGRQGEFVQLSLEDDVTHTLSAIERAFDVGSREKPQCALCRFGQGVVVGSRFVREEYLRQRGIVDEHREVTQFVAVEDEIPVDLGRFEVGIRFAERRSGKGAMC